MTDDITRPCSETRTLQRTRYFDGQLMTAADFAAEQAYVIDKLRAHNRLLHGYGTVCGLGVVPTDPPSGSVVVEPGMAIDCCGREIVLIDPVEVDLAELLEDAKRSQHLYLTVAYHEVEAVPVPVPGGEMSTEASRIRETGRVGVARHLPVHGDPPNGNAAVRPCPPCDDPRVVLASIRRSRTGRITAADIDNGVRRVVTAGDRDRRDLSAPCRKGWLVVAAGAALAWALLRRCR